MDESSILVRTRHLIAAFGVFLFGYRPLLPAIRDLLRAHSGCPGRFIGRALKEYLEFSYAFNLCVIGFHMPTNVTAMKI